jgi:hypothetical protein
MLPAPTPTPIPTGLKEGQLTPDGQLIYRNGVWQLLVPITPTPVPTPTSVPTPVPTLIPKELYSYVDVARLGFGDYGASITELLWQEYGVIGREGRLVPPIDQYRNVAPLEQWLEVYKFPKRIDDATRLKLDESGYSWVTGNLVEYLFFKNLLIICQRESVCDYLRWNLED